MPTTPTRVGNRLSSGLKTFQPVLEAARSRDVNESDTVIIVTDLLSDLFGYDKYAELTSEVSIRGTYCDLAAKVDNEIQFLVEVKAIGSELKEGHTRQAVDYAANQGVDWVVLTNGAIWKVYRVLFNKPVEPDLVIEFDLLELDPKLPEDIGKVYLLSKEGFHKSALAEYDAQRQALNRFCVAALVISDPVVAVIRRELRRLSPEVRIAPEQVRDVMEREVLKRDVLEDERAADAKRRVAKVIAKATKQRAEAEPAAGAAPAPPANAAQPAPLAATAATTSTQS